MRWIFTLAAGSIFVLIATAFTAAYQQPAGAHRDGSRPHAGAQVATNAAKSVAGKKDGTIQMAADFGNQAELIARGKYLANNVALCVICHSPKDEHGNVIDGQHFKGDVIPVKPIYASLGTWAERAPALEPLVGGAEDEVIELLQTGIWPRTGQPPRRPMPPFHMTKEDAVAVVTYLRSLGKT